MMHPGVVGQPMMGAMVGGLWRKGNLLVMHKSAQLPDVCVKSGEPAVRRLKRNLQWYHPAINFTLLLALLLYIILVAVLSQRATIYIGLSEKWFQKRRLAIILGWLFGLGGTAMFFGSFALVETVDWWGVITLLGLAAFLFGLIYGQYGSRMVHPKKIDEQYIWLKGVHPSVLAKLPEWPYPA